MKKIQIHLLTIFTFLIIVSCAKRGTITGGDKDTTPPKIISSSPKNFSTSFNKNSIKIYFDEYIKVKDLEKQLIVSPPMKTPITVLPQGSASKYISIKINDTLIANTTYSFNFGQSIVDYNEGNPYPHLKYVFSTGALIDSLSIEGTIKDAYEKESPKFVNVMLYEVDDKYNDSIIYKQNPRYIVNTLDSLKTFKIDNIKAGQYKLVALKQASGNYKFNPNKDKIGFYNQTITVPDKSIFELELFKEEKKFKVKKPSQASGNRVLVGYDGNSSNIKIDAKKNNVLIKTRLTKFQNKDSLQLWFAPIKNDSLLLNIENGSYKKDFMVKIKNQRQDSLKLTSNKNRVLNFKENFSITSSTPLDKFDVTKMTLTKKDSSKIAFKTNYDEYNQSLEILFTKESDEKYKLSILPNAIEDYLGQKNDSLNFQFSTKNPSDYGNIKIVLENVKRFPVIVELTDKSGKLIASEYSEKDNIVNFNLLEPNKFTVRLIYDDNKNKVWDAGNYLEKIQSEEVIYLLEEISLHSNFDWEQVFDLSK